MLNKQLSIYVTNVIQQIIIKRIRQIRKLKKNYKNYKLRRNWKKLKRKNRLNLPSKNSNKNILIT
jgi:hypothetical protein